MDDKHYPQLASNEDFYKYLKLEKSETHKRKEKQFSTANNIIKYSPLVLIGGIEISSIALALIYPSAGNIALILGSIGGASELLSELLIRKIIGNEKKKYLRKWIKTKATLDKVYNFSNKAMIDELITDDEILECRNILNEYENEKINCKSSDSSKNRTNSKRRFSKINKHIRKNLPNKYSIISKLYSKLYLILVN